MLDVFDDVGATPNLKTVLFSAHHAELIFRSLSSHTPRLPSLQYVKCGTGEGYDIMGCPMDRFPWAGIRHCDLGFDSKRTPVTVFEALRLGGNLESLLFHGQANVGLDQKPYRSREEYSEAVVSSLKTLSIRLGNYKGFYGLVNDFIYGVTLPHLNDLSISLIEPATLRATEGFELRGEWPRKAFCNFFKRSGCTLTTLVLEGIPLLTLDVVSVLRSTPQLQSFTLCELWAVPVTNESECSENSAPGTLYKTVTESFRKRLEAPAFGTDMFATQHPLLPRLTFLKLGVQSHFDADRAFVDMVKSRWNRPNGDVFSYNTEVLRTAVLHIMDRAAEEAIYEPLKRLDGRGMMVTVLADGRRVV
ncbi:hypothetical protein AAF712_004432 [Marasmius tenuissimus]|uniref:Uncharacterized protein n=1 Tax=Marasmius tenuissimus TaxID=585030 RepID=A0ABR3A4U3_9AGAR